MSNPTERKRLIKRLRDVRWRLQMRPADASAVNDAILVILELDSKLTMIRAQDAHKMSEEMITRHFVHEREEITDEIRRPVVEKNIFVLFRLEEGNAVDADLPQCVFVEGKKQAMEMPAQAVVETRDELRDLLLRDGGREVDVPNRQAGERLRIARK